MIEVMTRPDGGGAEVLVRELTARLPSYGVEVYTLYFNNPANVPLGQNEESLGVVSYYSVSTFFCLLKKLLQLQNRQENILLHAHLTWPFYHMAFASRFLKGTLIYTEHSTYNRRRKWFWLRLLERWTYAKYSSVICISEGVRIALKEWLGRENLSRRMITIKNGARILPMVVREPSEGRPLRLISIGSLNSGKGFDVAIQAVASMGKGVEEYVLLGEGPEREQLMAVADSLGVGHKVRMPGFCNDILPYLRRADLGVIPSRWEGFGLVAIEALSTGLPLVASDVPGLNDVLADCPAAILCEPDNVSALVRAVKEAQTFLVGRAGTAEAARKHAERFDVETMVKNYAQLYTQLWEYKA